ncbi:uncharacterized protein LOC109411539 [Aedes albopictus]|uniref:Uncharacterized protein n=1 Tax=Aedes albopictus TaxID=7160 RepID=A0ABM1Z0X9_AEDAL
MGNADFCSLFSLQQNVPVECDVEYVKSLNLTTELPMNFSKTASETAKDEFLLNLRSFLENGWPEKIDKTYLNVHANQHDLEIVEDCVAIGNVTTNAHRNQLKIPSTKPPTLNVMVPVTSSKRSRMVTVMADEDIPTASDSFSAEETISRPINDPVLVPPTLRRSTRTKRRKINEDFIYK